MSSDMMVICKEDDSSFEGKGTDTAIFIDECSMGDPWHNFGQWFQRKYCGSPSMIAQMIGVKEHNYIELTKQDIVEIKSALSKIKRHENLDVNKFIEYLKCHLGKHISTENW